MKKIYLAGGCFWGLQAYFKGIPGIIKTEVGYANGLSDETNYRLVKETKHAETVEIVYEPNIINLAEILDRFLLVIDPYSLNKQGNDVGVQYRTGIYYLDEFSKKCANLVIHYFEKSNKNKKCAIEIEPLRNFVKAEEYHQDYLDKNPGGYCHINISIKNKPLSTFRKLNANEIQKLNLSKNILDIMLNKDTEMPYSSEFDKFSQDGLYIDKISKQVLFSSDDKYDAGCGWPSFTKGITTDAMNYQEDYSLPNRKRIEVLSQIQDAHLGHVFKDGPKDFGGLRYCINGATLDFIPFEKLENTPYERFIPYFKKAYEN